MWIIIYGADSNARVLTRRGKRRKRKGWGGRTQFNAPRDRGMNLRRDHKGAAPINGRQNRRPIRDPRAWTPSSAKQPKSE